MFDKLKELNEIRKIQSELKKQSVSAESQGTKIVLNGNMELVAISLNESLTKDQQEKAIKDAYTQASKELQKILQNTIKF